MQEQVLKEGYDPAYGARPGTISTPSLRLSVLLDSVSLSLSFFLRLILRDASDRRPLRRAITRMLEASLSCQGSEVVDPTDNRKPAFFLGGVWVRTRWPSISCKMRPSLGRPSGAVTANAF